MLGKMVTLTQNDYQKLVNLAATAVHYNNIETFPLEEHKRVFWSFQNLPLDVREDIKNSIDVNHGSGK